METLLPDPRAQRLAVQSLTHTERRDLGPGEPGLVSIIIPTYRRLHDLRLAVASALAQTHQKIEVIVHPLQRRVGEDEIETLTEPRFDAAGYERQSRHVPVRGFRPRQHCV